MGKYIDADRLKEAVEKKYNSNDTVGDRWDLGYDTACEQILSIIDSLQQEQLDIDKIKREWYNKGYLEGRKNAHIPAKELGLPKSWDFQQEQPDDVCSVIKEYYEKEPPLEDERKAAYHFFSAGRAFELKKIEEERVKHITNLLDNYQKGKKAGYKEAISELKEGKIECSPVMKELIDKLFGIGNAFNFGFGPKDFLQEQPESSKGKFVFPNYLYARTVDNKTIDVSYAPQSLDAVEYIKNDPTEQTEVDFEKEVDKLWQEGVNGLFGVNNSAVDFARIRNIALHFFNLGLNARKKGNK